MWSLTFACPPNVADLNLAYVHPTPWSFWSSITLASIVHLSFLLIASPAYIKPASESMRAPLHRWWTHRSNSNLDVWLVGEWMSNFASPSSSSPALRWPRYWSSSGWEGCIHFFSSGWLVRNLRAQGAKIWLQQRRSTCRWPGVLPRREGAQVRATPSARVFIFNPYMYLGCLAASDHTVRPS